MASGANTTHGNRINPINTPIEFLEVFGAIAVMVTVILVPFVVLLQPSPKRYISFLKDTWNVKVYGDGMKPFRWLPHMGFCMFTSFVLGQAVHTTLHYALLVDDLGATVLQVGYIDAASMTCATIAEIFLRATYWRKMSRRNAFLIAAMLNVVSYSVIIGLCLPRMNNSFWALLAVFCSEALAGLNLNFQEFGVMRNDLNADIVKEMTDAGPERPELASWKNAENVGLKLGQLTVVLRYPATIVATSAFGPFIGSKNIYNAYFAVGILFGLLGVYMAWCWRDHVPDQVTNKANPVRQNSSVNVRSALAELKPGGPYFKIAISVGLYNAVLEVTRKGYVRLLNLRAITSADIANSDIVLLLQITFGVSIACFWLSDTASNFVASRVAGKVTGYIKPSTSLRRLESARSHMGNGKKAVGIVSFLFMSLGHMIMGAADGFYGLLVSGIFFGFGQATSTGLRTVLKDDLRRLLRSQNETEAYRRQLLRMVSAAGTWFSIVSSLLVGYVGNTSLSAASILYGVVALGGIVLALCMDLNVTSASVSNASSGVDTTPFLPDQSEKK